MFYVVCIEVLNLKTTEKRIFSIAVMLFSDCFCVRMFGVIFFNQALSWTPNLRMQSRACVKTCGAMQCSCCRMVHCSSVTDMAVRSLALLQLVTRTPLRRRQT